MCGILGCVSNSVFSLADRNLLKQTLKSLMHRGPDNTSIWISDNKKIFLGHSRLSIIDLSKKNNQPQIDRDNNIIITYNGEIYNFDELKKELINKGHHFRTAGDTEVLVESYKEWGVDFLNKIDGMFAFALVDLKKNIVLLSRDPAGQKPLYYSFVKNNFIFLSELSFFNSMVLDDCSINEFLHFGFNLNNRTTVKDIFQIKPGHYGLFDLKTFNFREYKYFKFKNKKNKNNNSLFYFEDILNNSVKSQLKSDVATGLLLSGGLDSSIISTLASKHNPDISAYSAVFPEYPDYNEHEYSSYIAKFLKLDHKILKIKNINPDLVFNILKKVDIPIFDSSFIPTFLICKELKKFCKVAVGGDGADELFGGYNHFSYLKIIKLIKKYIPKVIYENIIKKTLKKNYNFKFRQYLVNLFSSYNFIPIRLDNDIREAALNPNNCNFKKTNQLYNINFKFSNDTYNSFFNYLSQNILNKIDRASMLNSLELRSPFLSKDIINFSFTQLSENQKYNFIERKIFLKKFSKKILPKKFNFSRKKGFSFPLKELIKEKKWINFFHDILVDKDSLFNKLFIENLLDMQKRGHDNSENLYGMLALEIWKKNRIA